MKELYKVPFGKQYVLVVWEVGGKRIAAAFDEINGTISQTITL